MSSSARPKQHAAPSEPRPSASVILVSATNEILLLHRVQTSTSFPSAHVFPGGNISPAQDGDVPAASDALRHEDGLAYRLGAIRECFEESGILLAKKQGNEAQSSETVSSLLELPEEERMERRKETHSNKLNFPSWLAEKGAFADTDGLISFTRWVTPANLARRFTTQMYIYFLPLASSTSFPASFGSSTSTSASTPPNTTLIPTPDNGIEHTAASFLPASEWLSLADSGEIILFPPQYYLLSLIAPFLSSKSPVSPEVRKQQRDAVVAMVSKGDPPLGDRCISPISIGLLDQKSVLGLEKPGREVEQKDDASDNSHRKRVGVTEHVVLVEFDPKTKSPRKVEIKDRKEILGLLRKRKEEKL
ncbi:MAG: hypothetical protein M4579_001840 [Chaenotheca gracillima]|nr:MAG: hypothetical protein M4579_001840 [Chaenotheca gracillima]